MSKDTIVAKRYAKALFEVAESQGIISQVESELKEVVSAIENTEGFELLLKHPKLDETAKHDLLKNAFQGKVSDAVYNTIQLLVERRREELIDALLSYYVVISNEALGQADAIVYSPSALTGTESESIKEQFGTLSGKTLRVENVVNPSLLGGIQVRIGDRLYDGSISGKLARLEKTLNQAQAL